MDDAEHDEDAGAFDDSHRAFLQALFAHSVLTFDEAKPILAAILTAHRHPTRPNDISWADFDAYLQTAHNALEKFGYEVRSTLPQTAPSRAQNNTVFALVNAVSDPQTQLATVHSPDALAFVKRVLDAIFDSNNTPAREVLAVKATDAVRLCKVPRERDGTDGTGTAQSQTPGSAAATTTLTMKQAEEVLGTLVDEGWLSISRSGYYSLAPRGLLELRGYLEETYNDPDAEEGEWQRVKKCAACRDFVTVGQRCANQECIVRLHDFCTEGYFRGQKVKKCACGTEWTGNDFVGEKAARGYVPAGRTSTSATTAARRRPHDGEETI